MNGDRQHHAHAPASGPAERTPSDRPVLRIRDVREGAPCKGAPAVLLIAADRRFRDVVALLLERRGCAVSTTASIGALAEHVERDHPDVAVIDASGSPAWATRAAVAVSTLQPALGIVIVEEGELQAPGAAEDRLSKWGSFQILFDAVERAAHEVSSPA
jgi:DNA-binding NtrC family response regulator